MRPDVYAKNELRHSIRRLRERGHADLNEDDIKEICKQLGSPNMRIKCLLKRQEHQTVWLIKYKGKLLRPVYNEETKMTTTFLDVFVTHELKWEEHEKSATGFADSSLGSIARITKWKR